MTWAVTDTSAGESSVNICTISSTAATTDSCNGWGDYDQTVTIPQAATNPPANTRWQSSAACTFTPTTGGNTENCNSYKQLDNTYQASTNGQGPPTWDSGLSAVVLGSLYGSSGQSICTISPSSGTTTTASCTGYADYNAAVSEPSTMSGVGSNIQWMVYGTSSWTDTTGANTHTGTYYKQLQNTYQVTAEAQSTFDTSMSWTITGTIGGTGSSTVCTISSTAAATDSCSGYADYDLGVNVPQAASSPPANTRWQSSAACTFTQTSGGNTNNCNSYKQLTNTYQASTNGQGPPTWDSGLSATVTGSLYGSTGQTICTISPSSGTTTTATCSGYADYDATVSEPSTMSGAGSNIQWKIYGTSSWTDTTGANTHTGAYYKQLSNTYQETAITPTTFDTSMSWAVTGTVGGVGSSAVCTISSTAATTDTCIGISDYNLAVTIPQAVSSPPANSRWQSSAACSFTQTTGGNTNNCNSYKQWTNTFEMQIAGSVSGFTIGSGSGESMVVLGYLYGSSGQTICTATASSGSSATCSGYSDNAEAATLPQFLTGEAASTQWQNSNGASQSSGSITSGANTFTASYYLQLSNTYQASTNGQGPPDWDSGLSAAATGTLLGVSSQTICTISPSSGTTTTAGCTGYADYDQPVSEPSTMSGAAANIQWKLYGTSSWTDTTAGNTHTGTYYKQLR